MHASRSLMQRKIVFNRLMRPLVGEEMASARDMPRNASRNDAS